MKTIRKSERAARKNETLKHEKVEIKNEENRKRTREINNTLWRRMDDKKHASKGMKKHHKRH